MNTPLGHYGPLVAAIVAAGAVLSYIGGALFAGPLGISPGDLSGLKEVALIALGAVFGSTVGATVSTNGLKREVAAAHHRLDVAGAPPAADHVPPPGG